MKAPPVHAIVLSFSIYATPIIYAPNPILKSRTNVPFNTSDKIV